MLKASNNHITYSNVFKFHNWTLYIGGCRCQQISIWCCCTLVYGCYISHIRDGLRPQEIPRSLHIWNRSLLRHSHSSVEPWQLETRGGIYPWYHAGWLWFIKGFWEVFTSHSRIFQPYLYGDVTLVHYASIVVIILIKRQLTYSYFAICFFF